MNTEPYFEAICTSGLVRNMDIMGCTKDDIILALVEVIQRKDTEICHLRMLTPKRLRLHTGHILRYDPPDRLIPIQEIPAP